MSSSFVEYRGRGFWSRDGYLEHVLALMVQRIGDSPEQKWLEDLRDPGAGSRRVHSGDGSTRCSTISLQTLSGGTQYSGY